MLNLRKKSYLSNGIEHYWGRWFRLQKIRRRDYGLGACRVEASPTLLSVGLLALRSEPKGNDTDSMSVQQVLSRQMNAPERW